MQPLRVSIEIDPGQQPIRGRLRVTGAADVTEFAGWVEFVQVLERARATAQADRDHRRRSGQDD